MERLNVSMSQCLNVSMSQCLNVSMSQCLSGGGLIHRGSMSQFKGTFSVESDGTQRRMGLHLPGPYAMVVTSSSFCFESSSLAWVTCSEGFYGMLPPLPLLSALEWLLTTIESQNQRAPSSSVLSAVQPLPARWQPCSQRRASPCHATSIWNARRAACAEERSPN